jgi:hypothetical protein
MRSSWAGATCPTKSTPCRAQSSSPGRGSCWGPIQANLFERAKAFQSANTRRIDDRDDFYAYFTPRNKEQPEIHGGFALSHWCGGSACEARIKEDLTVTIRCVPFDARESAGPLHLLRRPQPETRGVCQGLLAVDGLVESVAPEPILETRQTQQTLFSDIYYTCGAGPTKVSLGMAIYDPNQ